MLKIGHLQFDSPFVLAPLAGYTDLPFRLLCKEYGAGYTVSEMVSCHGLVYKQAKTFEMLATVDLERPVSFQLFGAEPEIMLEAAIIMQSFGPDIIDINMGCPVRKVTKKGAGAALMSQPKIASEIISRITKSVQLPVTVKIRAGKDSNTINAPDFAKMAEDCGVAAITIHGRTWAQGFSGNVDHKVIAEVAQAVSIPVIGNGDVANLLDARQMMDTTGCNGVMIGRAALGSPWVFNEEHPEFVSFSPAKVITTALHHLDLMEQFLEVRHRLGYIKSHMSRYFKGWPGCSSLRRQIFEVQDVVQLKTLLKSFRDTALTS